MGKGRSHEAIGWGGWVVLVCLVGRVGVAMRSGVGFLGVSVPMGPTTLASGAGVALASEGTLAGRGFELLGAVAGVVVADGCGFLAEGVLADCFGVGLELLGRPSAVAGDFCASGVIASIALAGGVLAGDLLCGGSRGVVLRMLKSRDPAFQVLAGMTSVMIRSACSNSVGDIADA